MNNEKSIRKQYYSDKDLRKNANGNDDRYMPKYIINELIVSLKDCIKEMKKSDCSNKEVIQRAEYLELFLIKKVLFRG